MNNFGNLLPVSTAVLIDGAGIQQPLNEAMPHRELDDDLTDTLPLFP